eukprot:SAG11_NODE_217_length_12229_cov_9.152185_18_plen_54_part_00
MPHFHSLVEHVYHVIPYLRAGLSQPVRHYFVCIIMGFCNTSGDTKPKAPKTYH